MRSGLVLFALLFVVCGPLGAQWKQPVISQTHDVRALASSDAELRTMARWAAAVAGADAKVLQVEGGYLIVRANAAAQRKVNAWFKRYAKHEMLEFEIEVQELRGDATKLAEVCKLAGAVLRDRDELTRLLVRARYLGGITLKNHLPQKLRGIHVVAGPAAGNAKHEKREKNAEPGKVKSVRQDREAPKDGKRQQDPSKSAPGDVFRVGTTDLDGKQFLARTWQPDTEPRMLEVGQVLVVPDNAHGRLLLVRFTGARRVMPDGWERRAVRKSPRARAHAGRSGSERRR
ncbi:MAG: hypothetical protein KDC87_15005 [Planctomycetes bacterium]|nr:hypothetical protein [Planctomycetota bacterium]